MEQAGEPRVPAILNRPDQAPCRRRGHRCRWVRGSPPAAERRVLDSPKGISLWRDRPPMSIAHSILMRMFGRPKGILGRLGGIIMARMNQQCASWVIDLLGILPHDKVLEVGFGPGVAIELLARSVSAGYVAGVDPSEEMVEQAKARNLKAIQSSRVDLRPGFVENLPFEDNTFTKALAINSMQVWPDTEAALREMRRVMKPGGRIALGFTPYSGQSQSGLLEKLTAADFSEAHLVEAEEGFCALAIKP